LILDSIFESESLKISQYRLHTLLDLPFLLSGVVNSQVGIISISQTCRKLWR